MGFWSSLLKYGGKAARGTGHVIGVTGKTLGSAALHPQRTLMGAGKAMQTAAVGSAAGYVTWEKLTTDKSVARIVGDAVIGENATEAVAQTANDVQRLTGKAGEAVDAVNTVAGKMDTQFSGISEYVRRRRMRHDRQSLWQYRQGQRVGYEHRRTGGCRLHGIRTLWLDEQDCGCPAWSDDHREQF